MKWKTIFTISNKLFNEICYMYSNIIKDVPDGSIPQRTKHVVMDSTTWTFYDAEGLHNVKQQLGSITGFNLLYEHGYGCIWRYDDHFPKCPVHIDYKAQHIGSLCISVSGSHRIYLHDETTHEKNESVILKNNKIMFLKNSEYWHSVEGQGDLLIFGCEDIENRENHY